MGAFPQVDGRSMNYPQAYDTGAVWRTSRRGTKAFLNK
jgi:hypothetical protein